MFCVVLRKEAVDVWYERPAATEQVRQMRFLPQPSWCCELISLASTQVVAAMQADDFVAICHSIEEARAVAEIVYQYSRKWLFRLNAKKSAILHAAPNRQHRNLIASSSSFSMWNGVNVHVVGKCCYLGLWFQKQS
jgi:hypothetical protein